MAPGPTNGTRIGDEPLRPSNPRNSSRKILPWHFIKNTSVTSIEHPFIVQDLKKGLDILGGERRIKQIVAKQDENKSIELSLNPRDPMCRPIRSTVASTGDVLLKFTLPKRTGRKRKRGSDEPWIDDQSHSETQSDQPSILLHSLQDNADNYSLEVPGIVDKTHRFQDLADFQYFMGEDPLTEKIKNGLLDLDFKKIKTFNLDIERAREDVTSLFPPPMLTAQTLPFTYGYQQNPSVHLGLDASGQPLLMNTQQAQKIFTQRIQYNNEKTPSGIDPKTPELSTQEPGLQKIVKKIKDLMKTRPMWTRRALINVLGSRDTTVKQATQYVGYMFTSGPWRDTIIRYGLDPRTDPSCRFYQSFGFQIVSNEPGEDGKNPDWAEDKVNYQRNNQTNAPATASHIFDGKTLIRDGKVWQVCDVTDPLLHGLLATKDIRPTCDIRCDGWYHNGLWAKVKTIMRAKIRSLMQGKIPRDLEFARLLQIPDVLDNHARGQGGDGGKDNGKNSNDNPKKNNNKDRDQDASPAELALAHEVRQRASDKSSAKKPVPRKKGSTALSLLGGMRIGVDGPALGAGPHATRLEDVTSDSDVGDIVDDADMDMMDLDDADVDNDDDAEADAEILAEPDSDVEVPVSLGRGRRGRRGRRGLAVVSMDEDDVDVDEEEAEDEDEDEDEEEGGSTDE